MAVPSGVDPREVLGVDAGAGPAEVAAAFRRLAKRWHPDLADAPGAADRMALINAAYDALRVPETRAGAAGRRDGPSPGDDGARPAAADGSPRAPSDDLSPAVRRALGRELRQALQPGEDVGIVVPCATWASPQTTLVVTDRRLLWLLDDVPVHRVRTVALDDVAAVRVRPPRPWRRRAVVDCTDRRGRRTSFGELPTPTAQAVARRIDRGRSGAGRGAPPRPAG